MWKVQEGIAPPVAGNSTRSLREHNDSHIHQLNQQSRLMNYFTKQFRFFNLQVDLRYNTEEIYVCIVNSERNKDSSSPSLYPKFINKLVDDLIGRLLVDV